MKLESKNILESTTTRPTPYGKLAWKMEIILNHWQLEGMTSNHTNQFIELAFKYDKNKMVIL